MSFAENQDLQAPLLDVRGLVIEFHTARGVVQAVRGVDLTIKHGETLAILGESGSGKSVTARAVLGILQSPPGHIAAGTMHYAGRDLQTMPKRERRAIQGDRIAMIFQDALAALNPVYQIGWQIAELFKIHRGLPIREGRRRAVELLRRVGIPQPETRASEYAHQFSGGMRQRAMIAIAVALEPDILLADEPTTALDVTVQAQIMQLLARLQRETGMALVLITHDVAVASEVADRIAVMYAGRVVETGPMRDVLRRPTHPYSAALVALATERDAVPKPIPGSPPDMIAVPPGCAFHPRCPMARNICRVDDPMLRPVRGAQQSACHFAEELVAHG